MRPWLVVLPTVLLATVASVGFFFVRPVATINVSPVTASVSFGGEVVSGKSTVKVWPGTYELRVEAEGYVPLVKEVSLPALARRRLEITLEKIPTMAPVSNEEVMLVGLSADQKSLLYLANLGQTLYERTADAEKALTPDVLNRPTFFKLSPAQDVAVFKNAANEVVFYDFKRYDLIKQEQFVFGRDIGSLDWLYPKAEQLFYAYEPPGGERSLVLADRTNKVLERVANLNETGLTRPAIGVAPDGKKAVVISRPGDDFMNYDLFVFDFFTKKISQLTSDGSKIEARFIGNDRMLFTRFDTDPAGAVNQLLSVIDADGKNRKDFNLRTTLDRVTVLDDNHLVVAVSDNVGEKLVRLDLLTGRSKSYYASVPEGVLFSKIVLSADKKYLYLSGGTKVDNPYGLLYATRLINDEY